MHDATYVTDLLEFSKILFDSSKRIAISDDLKNLVLFTLGLTSAYFSLNIFYESKGIDIEMLVDKKISRFRRLEYRLAHDPLVKLLMPCLFFEIPIMFARSVIFYQFRSIDFETFFFFLKNFAGIILTVLTYFEISDTKLDGIFSSSDGTWIRMVTKK